VEENKIFAMESNRQNYSLVYVSRGVFGRETGRKKDTGLNDYNFLSEFKLPSIYF